MAKRPSSAKRSTKTRSSTTRASSKSSSVDRAKLADYESQLAAIGKSQAVIEFELDGTIITANDNFCSAVGYAVEEIEGQHHRIFVADEVKFTPEYKQFWADLASGQFKAGEFERFRKDGASIWIQASYNPIFDANGEPYKVVKFATDITEAKNKMADFTGQLQAIGKSQAVIEFELDGTIITANDNFLVVTGYSLDEIKGRHHRMFVEDEYARSSEYKHFWEALGRGEFKSGEFQRFGRSGDEIWIQASYNPIFDPNGNPYKVVKYASDITAAKHMAVQIEETQKRDKEQAEKSLQQVDEILNVVQRVSEGDYSQKITVESDDAIGNLAQGLREYFADKELADTDMARINSMVEQAPTNIMFADTDLIVKYMNPASFQTLKTIEEHLPVRVEAIVGQCIDIFHKNPSHQRNILGNPNNLPVQSQIKVGPEVLDLVVSPIRDKNGTYLGSMVNWEVITEKLRAETEMARISSMVEQSPSNVMFADTDLVVQYMNPASLKTLKSIESHLPIRPEDIIGQCIDIFHKNPSHQRRILADPNNLPVQSQIEVGPETLDLTVSAVKDKEGNYLGAMVNWEVITAKLEMERQMKEKAETERKQAEETQRKVEIVLELVNAVADGRFDFEFPDLGTDPIGQVGSALAKAVGSIRDALVEVRDVSSTVATASTQMSSAADEISRGAQKQAARLEETAASLEEITTTVKQNSENAQEARALANSSRDIATDGGAVVSDAVQAMSEINASSKKIADIITTIDEIAFQTNLLALNAAVEAARAGEQGRGFAVVAAEVRNLAQRSASSAKEIKSLIQDSNSKVEKGTELVNRSGETLGEIVDSVKRVTDIVAEIAAASQEQLTGIQQVNKAVTQMDHVTQANASQTEELAGTSSSVLTNAQRLDQMVSSFELGNARPSRGAQSAPASAPAAQDSGVPEYAEAGVVGGSDRDEFMEF